jgi:hypothetical protein
MMSEIAKFVEAKLSKRSHTTSSCTCVGVDHCNSSCMDITELFLKTLMTSSRVRDSVKRTETVKRLIMLLLEGKLTPVEFMGTLPMELDCRKFSPTVLRAMQTSIPIILQDERKVYRGSQEIILKIRSDEIRSITDDGKLEFRTCPAWTRSTFRRKIQDELARQISEINRLFDYVEPFVSVETVALEWEDKIFQKYSPECYPLNYGYPTSEQKYKGDIVKLTKKLKGNCIRYIDYTVCLTRHISLLEGVILAQPITSVYSASKKL